MLEFWLNFFRLTRPLSNVKNVALVLLAFFLSGSKFDLFRIILGIVSLSLVCSAIYSFNTFSDYKIDKDNKNKNHYSQAVEYFGRKSLLIYFLLMFTGLIIGLFINIYFVFVLAALAVVGFFYSSNNFRFKEKPFLDIIFAAFLTYPIRFAAAWFIFSISYPSLLVLIALASAKSGGYLLYKDLDCAYLKGAGIKNSITILTKEARIILSVLFWLVVFSAFYFFCFESKYLAAKFLYLIPFALLPLVIIYLSVLNKIRIKTAHLRILGFIYWILIIVVIMLILNNQYV